MAEQTIARDPNPTELKEIFSTTADLANKFYVTVGTGVVRLAFAEGLQVSAGQHEYYPRAAVAVTIPDAVALAELILKALKPAEPQDL